MAEKIKVQNLGEVLGEAAETQPEPKVKQYLNHFKNPMIQLQRLMFLVEEIVFREVSKLDEEEELTREMEAKIINDNREEIDEIIKLVGIDPEMAEQMISKRAAT